MRNSVACVMSYALSCTCAGKQYVEAVGLTSPDPAAEAAMAVLLAEKQPRHTEGVMPVGQFPVNYFTVSEVEQWWDEDFRQAFKIAAGKQDLVMFTCWGTCASIHLYSHGGMELFLRVIAYVVSGCMCTCMSPQAVCTRKPPKGRQGTPSRQGT